MSKNIMVVDDDSLIRSFLFEDLTRRKYSVETAESAEQALKILKGQQFDVIISDIQMENVSGFEFLDIVVKEYPETSVILITAFGSVQSAIKAIKAGAYDYIQKPFTGSQVDHVLTKVFEHKRLTSENRLLKEELQKKIPSSRIIGRNARMQQIMEMIKNVARSPSTVLIQGESGTGKELIARTIHEYSDLADQKFLAKNCAAIPTTLLESELFGHVKGSFTGAITDRKGIFEEASGATLFLDEISELPADVQAKLLRVLQEGELQRVGDNKVVQVDVRIIASTNRDLKKEVQEKRFRSDLYYRLNVIPILLPPLRERKDDIALLADHFLDKYSTRLHRTLFGITEDGYKYLLTQPWEGNVRELENAVERAVLMASGNYLDEKSFQSMDEMISEPDFDVDLFNRPITIHEMEKHLIINTLKNQGGNRTRTADLLGISIRTLRNKLNEYRADDPDLDSKIS